MPLIELRDVSKTLGGVKLFSEVSLAVHAAQSLAIVGESGSGKSTLLHLMAALEFPDSGEVLWQGVSLTHNTDKDHSAIRLRLIGLVFQAFYLLPHLSVIQNVELPFLLAQEKPNRERAMALLDLIGLSKRAQSMPRELSGGEQQRVAIARALALAPKVILADEPTGNLDEANAAQVLKVLQQACEQQQCGLVVVTHSSQIARSMQSCYVLQHQHLDPRFLEA